MKKIPRYIAYTNESIAFDPNDLVFRTTDNTDIFYGTCLEKTQYGWYMTFTADRVPNWDSFVVVGHTTNGIKAIFPRIRYTTDTTRLGIDRTKEIVELVKCKCEVYYGCDGSCNCGADDYNRLIYRSKFKQVDINYLYDVYEIIPGNLGTNMIYIEFLSKDYTEVDDRWLSWMASVNENINIIDFSYNKEDGSHAVINEDDKKRLINDMTTKIPEDQLRQFYLSSDKYESIFSNYNNVIYVYDVCEQPYPEWFIIKYYINKKIEDIIM